MCKTKRLSFAKNAMACLMALSLFAMVGIPSGVAYAAGDASVQTQVMYRLYNPNSGEHFYTADQYERGVTVASGWNDEGEGWVAPVESETPVYRLYSGTDHHYTMDTVERDALIEAGWSDEGIGWYSDDQETVPLYRQFNPNVDPAAATNNSGSHNYTVDLDEHNSLVSAGWNDEGIGWYAVAASSGDPVPPPINPFNTGAIDTSKAAIGEDTPGLVSLEDAHNTNQLTVTEADYSKGVTVEQDIIPYLHTSQYGASVDLKIDLLTPSTAKAGETPLIVWINGGGFTGSNPSNNFDTRVSLAKAGYVVASVQHRVGPSATFPGPLQDIKAAIRFLKAGAAEGKYKFNPNKVAVGGNSSGGYYAAMVGLTSGLDKIQYPNSRTGQMQDVALDTGANLDQSSAVNCVLDFYGVSDLTIIGAGLSQEIQDSHKSTATTEAMLLNGAAAGAAKPGVFDPSMNDKVAAASPMTYVDGNSVPFIFFHGTADTLVSPIATKMLQNRLDAAGVHTERYVIDGAGHGGVKFEDPATMNKAIKFLDTYAKNDVSGTAPTPNTANGTELYKAVDLPTLEEAIAGAENITPDPNKWTLTNTTNVTYKTITEKGTYTNLRMHIISPTKAGEGPRPVLYMAASGGFTTSRYYDAVKNYLRYAERGYVVAVAEIRQVPAATNPGPLQDAKAGIRWLRAHADTYNINPDCIMSTGTSAGGYFACMLGVLSNTTQFDDTIKFDVGDNLEYSSAVQGVIDMYGVSDFTLLGAGTGEDAVHHDPANTEAMLINGMAFGKNPGASIFDNLEYAAKFSPFTYLDADDPSILAFHGTTDTLVSPISTMELVKRSKDLGTDSERYSIPGAGHGGPAFTSTKVNAIVDAYMDDIAAKYTK